jgi:general stress protein YciG
MATNNSNQGFAAMKEDDPARQRDIAADGGHSQGKKSNPANFANRSKKEMAKISKAGGESSHGGGNNS